MKVLIHLSHCSDPRPDGWSGAPGEAQWVRQLVALMTSGLHQVGIETTIVNGDYGVNGPETDQQYIARHPEIAQDHDLFIAPHYEADVHVDPATGQHMSGCFWGRASGSTTGPTDDMFGATLWSLYKGLQGVPPDRFPPEYRWLGVNVTDYYGFRCTSATTPGILVEHGVGAPGAPDHDWLNQNIQQIADTWVQAIAEFGGIDMGVTGDQVKDIIREMLGGSGFPPSPEGNKLVGDAWERSVQKAQLDTTLNDQYVKKSDGIPPHGHSGTVSVT